MPGLLRGMARTAVIAGTASAVSGRVQRRQAERFASRDQQIAATRAEGWYAGAQATAPPLQPAPAPAPVDTVTQLKELAELRNQGVLTEEEFQAQKAKILAS
jgi:hypothetical protein